MSHGGCQLLLQVEELTDSKHRVSVTAVAEAQLTSGCHSGPIGGGRLIMT